MVSVFQILCIIFKVLSCWLDAFVVLNILESPYFNQSCFYFEKSLMKLKFTLSQSGII